MVLLRHERHIGTDNLEGLRHRRRLLILVQRNVSDERNRKLALDVLAAVNLGIHEHNHKEHRSWHGKAEKQSQQDKLVSVRRNRAGRTGSPVNDTCIVVHHRL